MTDPVRCREYVYPNDLVFSKSRQCRRKAVKDGYCKQHHPDSGKIRDQKAIEKFESRRRKTAMGWHGEVFMEALIKIRDGDNDPRATASAALENCKYAPKGTDHG